MRKFHLAMLALCLVNVAVQVSVMAEENVLIKEAMEMSRNGNSEGAITKLQGVIGNRGSDEVKARISLGLVYFKLKNYDLALDEFVQVTSLKKDSPMAYYFMGMIYEEKAVGLAKDESIEMKKKALESWRNYLGSTAKIPEKTDESHRHIGVTREESVKSANKHIEMLKGEIENENK